jgi:copper(I)-binding protein
MNIALLVGAVVVAGVAFVAWQRRSEGTAGDPQVSITSAVVSEGSDLAAGYITIRNDGGRDDLIGATSNVGQVSVHSTAEQNGSIVMSDAPDVPIPARSTTKLQPGGIHLMFQDLHQTLQPGQTVDLTLTFRRSGPMPVRASVKTYTEIAASLEGTSP